MTLHYFSVRARGEPIRMLMRYADIPFTNVYVAVESWMGLKEKGVYAKAPGATHATLHFETSVGFQTCQHARRRPLG